MCATVTLRGRARGRGGRRSDRTSVKTSSKMVLARTLRRRAVPARRLLTDHDRDGAAGGADAVSARRLAGAVQTRGVAAGGRAVGRAGPVVDAQEARRLAAAATTTGEPLFAALRAARAARFAAAAADSCHSATARSRLARRSPVTTGPTVSPEASISTHLSSRPTAAEPSRPISTCPGQAGRAPMSTGPSVFARAPPATHESRSAPASDPGRSATSRPGMTRRTAAGTLPSVSSQASAATRHSRGATAAGDPPDEKQRDATHHPRGCSSHGLELSSWRAKSFMRPSARCLRNPERMQEDQTNRPFEA
jgi:hypothetical protein